MLRDDGWYLERTSGTHRQYKHEGKPGLVTVSGNMNDELAPGTLNSVLKQAVMKRCLIVIEETGTGYSAYSPDLPGCVSTGESRTGVEANMREAIQLHLEGLREAAHEVPEPHSYSTYVDVPA
jgi:predicted RNase H-like HicB family nuclease/predicted RNA binding protein YcfA (HicA-like mRNA interferase family)